LAAAQEPEPASAANYLPTPVSARPPLSAPVWVSLITLPSGKTTLLKRPTEA